MHCMASSLSSPQSSLMRLAAFLDSVATVRAALALVAAITFFARWGAISTVLSTLTCPSATFSFSPSTATAMLMAIFFSSSTLDFLHAYLFGPTSLAKQI